MISSTKSLLAIGIFSLLANASPLSAQSTNTLARRQGIWVEDPFCEPYFGGIVTAETLATLQRVWGEAFGTYAGDLPQAEPDWYQAVCCSGSCLYMVNLAGRDVSWDEGQFGEAVGLINEQITGDFGLCGAPTADDPYMALFLQNGGSVGGDPRDPAEIFGDTCEGAEGFRGQIT